MEHPAGQQLAGLPAPDLEAQPLTGPVPGILEVSDLVSPAVEDVGAGAEAISRRIPS